MTEGGHLALQVLADEQGSKWPARIAMSQSRYVLEHMGETVQSCSSQAHPLCLCGSSPFSAVQLGWKVTHCCQPYTTRECSLSHPAALQAGT